MTEQQWKNEKANKLNSLIRKEHGSPQKRLLTTFKLVPQILSSGEIEYQLEYNNGIEYEIADVVEFDVGVEIDSEVNIGDIESSTDDGSIEIETK